MALTPRLSSKRVTKTLTVANKLGLHARPAAELVRVTRTFRSQFWIVVGKKRYDAGRLMDVLTANLDFGATFDLEADGPDADAAVDRIEKLLIELRDAEARGEHS